MPEDPNLTGLTGFQRWSGHSHAFRPSRLGDSNSLAAKRHETAITCPPESDETVEEIAQEKNVSLARVVRASSEGCAAAEGNTEAPMLRSVRGR